MNAPPRSSRWLAMRVSAAAVAIYGVLAIAACRMTDQFLFRPEYAARVPTPGALLVPLADGTKVEAVFLPGPATAPLLWYFHGNAESLSDVLPRLKSLQAHGWNVFAMDYPGYGVSEGAPSEKSVYAATQAGWRYLQTQRQVTAAQLVLHGRSLGGGPATDFAAREPVAGLILESAFTSVYRVVFKHPLLPGDQFENESKLARVRCPVLVIHGREDRVVPFAHGEALLAAAPEPKQHRWVNGAGHNDILDVAAAGYWQALEEFRRSLRPDLPGQTPRAEGR